MELEKNSRKEQLINDIISDNFELANNTIKAKNQSFERKICSEYERTKIATSTLPNFKSAFIYELFLDLHKRDVEFLEKLAVDNNFLKKTYIKIKKEAYLYNRADSEVLEFYNSFLKKHYIIFLDMDTGDGDLENKAEKKEENEEESTLNHLGDWLNANRSFILTLRQQTLLDYLPYFVNWDSNRIDYKSLTKAMHQDNIQVPKSNNTTKQLTSIRKKILKKFLENQVEVYKTDNVRQQIKDCQQYLHLLDNNDFEGLKSFLFDNYQAENEYILDLIESDTYLSQSVKTKAIRTSKHGKQYLIENDYYEIKLTILDTLDNLEDELQKLKTKNKEYQQYLRSANIYDLGLKREFAVTESETNAIKINTNGVIITK